MAKELITGNLASLIQEANEHHSLAIRAAKASLIHARDAGLRLLEIKKQCQHGTFGQIVESESGLDMNLRTAQRYMEAARNYDSIVEKMGPSRAATISLSEGMAAIRYKEDSYFPPEEGPKTTSEALFERLEPVDGSAECPHGGPHDYDEEACKKCHDPKPAPVEAAPAPIANEKQIKSLFASAESHYIRLAQQLDQIQKVCPSEEKEGISTALSLSYKAFRTWRYGK